MNNDKKTPAELIERGVACCEAAVKEQGALSFNPFNAVIQCHACGRVYYPQPLVATPGPERESEANLDSLNDRTHEQSVAIGELIITAYRAGKSAGPRNA